jgi:hypothetical protein
MSMSLSRRFLALVPALLAFWPSGPLAAQLSWNGRLGATWTSPMVTDNVGTEVNLQPGLAPTLGFELLMPLKATTPLEASFEVQGTIASLYRKEDGSETDLLSMRTLTFTGGVTGRIAGPVYLRTGIGFVSYLSTEESAVFLEGTPTRLLGTAALEYRRTMPSGYRVTGLLRYDLHGFTTEQLQQAGYTGSQAVHRVMLGVGVGK